MGNHTQKTRAAVNNAECETSANSDATENETKQIAAYTQYKTARIPSSIDYFTIPSHLTMDPYGKAEEYKTRSINFEGRTTSIILQNINGPCALVGLCNALLLRNDI